MQEIFFTFKGQKIKITKNFSWSRNPYNIPQYSHNLMSLRWLVPPLNLESIKRVLLHFCDFHLVKQWNNTSYWTGIAGDHSTVIRLRKLLSLETMFQDDILILETIMKLITRDLCHLQKPEMYREGHNHGLMTDCVLVEFYSQDRFKAMIDIDNIIQRSRLTLQTMWKNNGETKEHSLSYQEYNAWQTLEYYKALDRIDRTYRKTMIDEKYIKNTTKYLLGYMLNGNGELFTLGDTLKGGNFNSRHFLSGENGFELFVPYAKQCGHYASSDWFAYRNKINSSAINSIHFATTCNWYSHNHKQNDEFHFVLEINGNMIFDDAGYTDSLSYKQLEILHSEFVHSNISIENHPFGLPKESNYKSKILSSHSNDLGFKVKAQHERIEGVKMFREFEFDAIKECLLIRDEIIVDKSLLGESLVFRFVLAKDIECEVINENLILLTSANQKWLLYSFDCIFAGIRDILYCEAYMKTSTTHCLHFVKTIGKESTKINFSFKECREKNLLEVLRQKSSTNTTKLPKITTNPIIKQIPIPSIYLVSKDRIHNHLAYKLGQAMILNSKSLLGYIRMPYVLSFIKEAHQKEQKEYQAKIVKNPKLKLPKLESYPDYKEALKEKECFTYKLGEALIKANSVRGGGEYLLTLPFSKKCVG